MCNRMRGLWFLTVCIPAAIGQASQPFDSNWEYVGTAVNHASGDQTSVALTQSTTNQGGAVWRKTQYKIASWTVAFDFLITGSSSTPADGFCFVLQKTSTTAGGGTHYAGSISPLFAVCVDTFSDTTPNKFTTNAFTSAPPQYTSTNDISNAFNSGPPVGGTANMAITYSGTTVSWSITFNSVTRSFTATNINIATVLSSSTAYMGFTANTGASYSKQEIANVKWTPTCDNAVTYSAPEGANFAAALTSGRTDQWTLTCNEGYSGSSTTQTVDPATCTLTGSEPTCTFGTSPSATASPSVSASVSPSWSVSPSVPASPSISASRTASLSVSPSITASSSVTSSATASPVSPSATPSESITPSITATSSVSPSVSSSKSVTPSRTVSKSVTASRTPSVSPSTTVSPSSSSSVAPSPSLSPTPLTSAVLLRQHHVLVPIKFSGAMACHPALTTTLLNATNGVIAALRREAMDFLNVQPVQTQAYGITHCNGSNVNIEADHALNVQNPLQAGVDAPARRLGLAGPRGELGTRPIVHPAIEVRFRELLAQQCPSNATTGGTGGLNGTALTGNVSYAGAMTLTMSVQVDSSSVTAMSTRIANLVNATSALGSGLSATTAAGDVCATPAGTSLNATAPVNRRAFGSQFLRVLASRLQAVNPAVAAGVSAAVATDAIADGGAEYTPLSSRDILAIIAGVGAALLVMAGAAYLVTRCYCAACVCSRRSAAPPLKPVEEADDPATGKTKKASAGSKTSGRKLSTVAEDSPIEDEPEAVAAGVRAIVTSETDVAIAQAASLLGFPVAPPGSAPRTPVPTVGSTARVDIPPAPVAAAAVVVTSPTPVSARFRNASTRAAMRRSVRALNTGAPGAAPAAGAGVLPSAVAVVDARGASAAAPMPSNSSAKPLAIGPTGASTRQMLKIGPQ